jgi:uroporphyrinogen decarboxylase
MGNPTIAYQAGQETTMDKLERLQASILKRDVDSIPCGFWCHFHPKFWVGQLMVDMHQKFYTETDVDILKIMNECVYTINCKINTMQDWKQLKPLDVKSHYASHLDDVREIRRRLGSRVPLFATVHGVLASACHASDGPGQFSDPNNTVTRHLKEDPEMVFRGLSTVAQSLSDLCNAFYDAGVTGIYYAALGGEEHRFTRELFESYIKPLEILILERAKERGIVILHICKDSIRLPMYIDYPADIVNWAIHDCHYGLKDGRELFPDCTLLGGFDDRSGVLVKGTEAEIVEKIHKISTEAGRNGLIFGADCTLPDDISYERIKMAINAARKL